MKDVHQQSKGTSGREKWLMKIKLGLERKWEEYRRQKNDFLFATCGYKDPQRGNGTKIALQQNGIT